jgi:D-serine deaminase-like pyridoxal phosphate-dependent protein
LRARGGQFRCAKLGEAEVFAAADEDIRLPYPINPASADRVLSFDRTRLSFIVGRCRGSAAGRADARQPSEVDVLVKVDGLSSLVSIPRAGAPPSSSPASPSCRGCGSGLSAMPGHAYGGPKQRSRR